MGKASKQTKKFQRNRLDETLKKRKEFKKKAQTFKKRKPTSKDAIDEAADQALKGEKKERNADLFDSMNVDDFMAGGFEAGKPKPSGKAAEKSKPAKKDASDSEEESEAESEAADDGAAHQDELKELSKSDPSFYKFLQENDADLLNFDNAEEADLDFSDEEESSTGAEVITIKTVAKWEQQMADKSLRSLRKVVLGFRAAAHLNEEDGKVYKFAIEDPEVFQRLTKLAVVEIPVFLDAYVPVKKSAGKVKVPTENKKFIKLIPLLKSHFATLLHFLQGLTEPDLQKQVLDASIGLVGYMLSFRKFLKDFVKAVLDIWSTSTSDATRVSAFLLVREFMLLGDAGLRESGLKLVYGALVKESRNVNVYSLPLINLMKNSASDLFGLDPTLSYQLIFGFLRQLAIVLRKAVNEKQKESYKTVYNWQFVNSLDFWSLTLAQHATNDKATLHPLIYPLVQVTLGAIKLAPSSQFFPLRFHLIRSLLRLSQLTGTYIPLAPIIFEPLESADMKRKPIPSTLRPMNFETLVRTKQEYLKTKVYQDQVGEQVVELLQEYYSINSASIAFPELAIPAVVQIKRYLKKTKNAKLARALQSIVERLQANGKFIEQKREGVVFNPRDTTALLKFSDAIEVDKTPLGAYVKIQRTMRQDAKKLIQESEERDARRNGKQESHEIEEELELLDDLEDEEEEEDDE
ncbi:Noc2p family-domain-containing protein [Protomyces lactucae-debilis]|uniref:Noc2p family-domain-containing protein n=1 Tax=Protomyces lactucae-debilis TaxID=2754530 RepID=A0A1Y2F232_PROLT|nr:Noc2p family-domain-containing protein [Protomyces lactucae-debilis]ORY77015.1 Noc2p family-domain-containing protein [Protomyces lactucae-debilis]